MRIQQKMFTRASTLFGVVLFVQCCCCIIPLPIIEGVFDNLWQVPGWLAQLNNPPLFQLSAVLFLP